MRDHGYVDVGLVAPKSRVTREVALDLDDGGTGEHGHAACAWEGARVPEQSGCIIARSTRGREAAGEGARTDLIQPEGLCPCGGRKTEEGESESKP
jgi:hypothetical protein